MRVKKLPKLDSLLFNKTKPKAAPMTPDQQWLLMAALAPTPNTVKKHGR